VEKQSKERYSSRSLLNDTSVTAPGYCRKTIDVL
jgi:hypothetical protein